LVFLTRGGLCWGWHNIKSEPKPIQQQGQQEGQQSLYLTDSLFTKEEEQQQPNSKTLGPSSSSGSNPSLLITNSLRTGDKSKTKASSSIQKELSTENEEPALTPTVRAQSSNADGLSVQPTEILRVLRVEFSDLLMEVRSSRPLRKEQIDIVVSRFLKRYLDVQYYPAVEYVEASTLTMEQRGASREANLTISSVALLDQNEEMMIPPPHEIDAALVMYLSSGGDDVLELALREVGIVRIESLAMNGRAIPRSTMAPSSSPSVEDLRQRGGMLRQPGAIAFMCVASLFACCMVAPMMLRDRNPCSSNS